MTLGEVLLWQRLKRKQMRGFDFDRQRPIYRYIVDFYCKDLKLAIEIDGSSHDSEEAKINGSPALMVISFAYLNN
jgi:very-short-patch-repair endonuclease